MIDEQSCSVAVTAFSLSNTCFRFHASFSAFHEDSTGAMVFFQEASCFPRERACMCFTVSALSAFSSHLTKSQLKKSFCSGTETFITSPICIQIESFLSLLNDTS